MPSFVQVTLFGVSSSATDVFKQFSYSKIKIKDKLKKIKREKDLLGVWKRVFLKLYLKPLVKFNDLISVSNMASSSIFTK